MTGSVSTLPAIRFLRHHTKSETGCWNWTGGLFKNSGYGKFNGGFGESRKRLTLYAHRFSYQANVGKIPAGLSVLHKCDNRRCVRPDHLFLGTQLDNIRDMWAKGRAVKRRKRPPVNQAECNR